MSGEKTLGKNLATLRKQHNLTQIELAGKLMVSQQIISNIENGKTTPDIALLMKMADIYNLSLDQLVGREFTGKEATDLKQKILGQIDKMGDKERKLSLELLQVVQSQGSSDGTK